MLKKVFRISWEGELNFKPGKEHKFLIRSMYGIITYIFVDFWMVNQLAKSWQILANRPGEILMIYIIWPD